MADPPARYYALVLTMTVLALSGASLMGATLTEISGMVALQGNTPERQRYLVVNDKKDRDRPEDQGARVGIITVIDDEGLSYLELDVPVDAWGTRPANDLEAACRVPGMEATYLLLESSYYKGRYGRIFMVRIDEHPINSYHLQVVRRYQLPRGGPAFNLEGLVCFSWRNGHHLLLGDRGDYAANVRPDAPYPRGTLFHAQLPDHSGEIVWSNLASLAAPAFAFMEDDGYRHCSDLFMQPLPGAAGTYRLWVAASYDPDNKTGPFRSEIYVAGLIDLDASSFETLFQPLAQARSGWRSDMLKIEALATSLTASSGMCVGSDGEALGGVWRNLGAMPPRRQP